jgi:transposase-like protein
LEAKQLVTRRSRTEAIPLDVKAAVLARAEDVGVSQAAREHGINPSTARGWTHRARQDLEALGRTVVLTDDSGKPLAWPVRRQLLLDAFSSATGWGRAC